MRQRLQTGHSAYFKSLKQAKKFAKKVDGKIKRTTHTTRGKGWLVYK